MYEKEALIMYKFKLCKNFLDKLCEDGLITKEQMKKIARIALNRLAEKV